MLLNAAKCQGYSFYRFWVIKGKPTRAGVKLLPPTQIRKTLCRDGSPSILSILEFLNQYFKYFKYGSSLIVVIQFQQKKQLWQRKRKQVILKKVTKPHDAQDMFSKQNPENRNKSE